MSAQPVNPSLPPDQVTIFIDGVELAAPRGSMIIQAADKAGIAIPRFCYHPKLPIAANCRMCMVDTEVGGRPSPKPSPACATPVMDGMKIHTHNAKAMQAQRNVMEFLLINHPLDCPVCDQGGECELQDLALGYGRSVNRFVERKRSVADENLGPLVSSDMTRCIHCTRCIRVTAEIAGTYELGGMYRGEDLQIGTYDGKPLTTELSGNVIDVCPVGALTDKVFRFKARPWEMIARPSLGYHDPLGSNLFLHTRRGEILRCVPRSNEAVNECWLSDRDRYAHAGLYSEDRASAPMLRENGQLRDASWDEALARAAQILKAHAGDALGVLVHPATSNEEGALLARLASGLGSGNIDHRISQLDLSDGAVAEPFGMPVEEIDKADAIVIVGSNIRHEVPLLHQRIRKAWKAGARVHVVNPVDFDFSFDIAGKHIVAPSKLADALGDVDLGEASHAVVVVGAVAENGPHAAAIRAAASAFAARTGAKLCRIPQGANALGLTRLGVLPSHHGALDMLRDRRAAYVLHGIEPALDCVDPILAMEALGAAQVIALNAYASESLKAVADVILPIGAFPETEASLTNLDGIEQQALPAGKLQGAAHSGWRVLRALGGDLGLPDFEFTTLEGLRETLQPVTVNVARGSAPKTGSGLELAVTRAIYRTDAVIRRCEALQAHPLTQGPRACVQPDDAAGMADGAMGRLGAAALPIVHDIRVARGCVWIETGYDATAPLAAAATADLARP